MVTLYARRATHRTVCRRLPGGPTFTGGVLVGEFNVLTAESGQQAIALCEEHPIAVAVLDVDMPGMDGYATCRALRARRPTLQILFLSSHDGLDEILRGYDAGGIDYILKPFRPRFCAAKSAALWRWPLISPN